jgi:hypothetical protein
VISHYAGKRYIWSVRQAAVAAATYPHYPPTIEGLEALQEQWANERGRTPNRNDKPADLTWAKEAFSKYVRMRIDPVPA